MEEFIANKITTKTVVGEPEHFGNVILIPLVDVSFGMCTGLMSSSTDDKKNRDGGGGGGLGAKMTPAAVVVIVDGTVQLVNVKNQESVNKMIDMVPGILSKLGSLFEKKNKDDKVEVKEEVKVEVEVKQESPTVEIEVL